MAVRELQLGVSLLLILLISLEKVSCQVLTPPYFNLAEGRKIVATATCGEDVSEPELFCKLTGATGGVSEHRYTDSGEVPIIKQGQLCDFCNPNDPEHAHPPEQAIDGTERWWQSPPLSRGLDYNGVNLTIDLGQVFHVAYVFIKMANSPRPGVWVLERSTDYGQTWKPWQYFADTESDCYNIFNKRASSQPVYDDDAICTVEYSKIVPLEGGEIVVSLVNNRPSSMNFHASDKLQEWTEATNIRLRLMRTKTLLGHLMAVQRQDPTVTRRYFYSIKDISIGGRCVCNGHADVCDKTDPNDLYKLLCRCQHNTCGAQCEMCCPGFVQKKWQRADNFNTFECERCQCYGHTDECVYNATVDALGLSVDRQGNYEGGGVCQNCRDNTEGINCEKCVSGYYRPFGVPRNATDACRPCNCDLKFSTGDCEEGTGICKCRPEYTGINCDSCAKGYYGYPNCRPCDCNINGTEGEVCEVGGGQCPCKPNYSGIYCDSCALGYHSFPQCTACRCDRIGSLSSICNTETGDCTCRNNFGGRDCDVCQDGFYGYPQCSTCDCDPTGTVPEICDKTGGQCMCKENFGGPRCDRCAAGYYDYPRCVPCQCADPGSADNFCSNYGQCRCKVNFSGQNCDQCAPGYYRYPECLSCSCDTYGTIGINCDQVTGQCACKGNFQGLTCDKCADNFYNYPVCEVCNCNPAGAMEVAGYPLGGCGSHRTPGLLCQCKSRVQGHICDQCKPGYWNLNINNVDGCEGCDCFGPGTVSGDGICNPVSGQCQCKPFASGRQCSTCVDGTYNLKDNNLFGCTDCDCDMGGSLDNNCDKNTGQCTCRPRVNGRRCDKPLNTHFFPTLYQHQYELEDGRTPQNTAVRYGYDDNTFPGYSWRGYAILSRIQPEVIVDASLTKSSLYRIIYRYVNRGPSDITADIVVTPQLETSTDVIQSNQVVFKPTTIPALATAGSDGTIATFVLNRGRWAISLKTSEDVMVDYLVLLPQEYYEATVLQERVNKPCVLPDRGEPCLHYAYVDVSIFPSVNGDQGYVIQDGQRIKTQLLDNSKIVGALGGKDLALLNNAQQSVYLDVILPNPGKYVFIVQYHTSKPDRQELQVEVASTDGREKGKVAIYKCDYSMLCRQVVTDADGKVAVFDVQSGYARITLTGDLDTDVAIESVVAIPLDQWNFGYVSPKLKCVRRDGKCIEGAFRAPTGSFKVEVENNENPATTNLPPEIIDVDVGLVEIGRRTKPTVRINVRISNPGETVIVVQYYNPSSAPFDVPVTLEVNGNIYKGTFRADYCPGVSGCRAVVRWDGTLDPTIVDIPYNDFSLVFNNTADSQLWLDYILAIPSFQYDTQVLQPQPIDKAGEFLLECAGDNFNISPDSPSVKPFCRRALFSLTTDYNNGGLQCNCNSDGSQSFQCNEFGGQCRCKPNVIGRKCTQCRTGYFGFPDCRPCDCPLGLCDPVSGRCVCPAKVTGQNCDTCLPQTFAYDPIVGCEDCNCDPSGVVSSQFGGELDCDLQTGQCNCKANVDGRRCDKCTAGHYNFPQCSQCNCDTRGTTEEICDQRLGACLCKVNTDGPRCGTCRADTFFLEERNPKGCTQCFCFGKTSKCSSSTLFREQVSEMEGWQLSNGANPQKFGTTLQADLRGEPLDPEGEGVYWLAPDEYLGNKITSFGGKLIFTIAYTSDRGDASGTYMEQADVKLQGNNLTIVHKLPMQLQPGEQKTVEVDILETNFMLELSGDMATREQFMQILVALDSLKIKASYNTRMESSRLSDVLLDIATESGAGVPAMNVEQCACPANYRGSSCEDCAVGYYRQETGPYRGVCVPCECNGHADQCDQETGVCIGCTGNTYGDHCELCVQGYYGDPRIGECQICPCPLPQTSNNFATSCGPDPLGVTGQIICECRQGYEGTRCERCSPGFYGDPTQPGEVCRPCSCSGNLDLTDPRSCDRFSGICNLRMCENNSTGDYCERCKDWFWGDAVVAKDCQPCTCDQCGSVECENTNGYCNCKTNVVGRNCDRCAPGHYGFTRCNGCETCACDVASVSPQCDDETGQCQCQPGVVGKKCERCQNGFWNYGPSGCTKCDCELDGATTCDPLTGSCQCLPGVTGKRCDRCFDRWVLIPEEGCRECDSCIHILLDDVEFLDLDVIRSIRNLQNISVGIFALERLNNISTAVEQLRPRLADIKVSGDLSALEPLKQDVVDLQNKAQDLDTRAENAAFDAVRAADKAKTSRDAALDAKDQVQNAALLARDAVEYVQDLSQKIQQGLEGQNIDELIARGEEILQEIKNRNFLPNDDNVQAELREAEDLLSRVKSLKRVADQQQNKTRELQQRLVTYDDRLKDLQDRSASANQQSRDAQAWNDKNRQEINRLNTLMGEGSKLRDEIQALLEMASQMLTDAGKYVADARTAYRDIERDSTRLTQAQEQLKNYLQSLVDENQNLRPLVDNATVHANRLAQQADILANLIADTKKVADNALKAAMAYESIANSIETALNESQKAVDEAKEALELSKGKTDEADASLKVSQDLLAKAKDLKARVVAGGDLKDRLDMAVDSTKEVMDLNAQTENKMTDLSLGLGMLPAKGAIENLAKEAAAKAMDAENKADAARSKVQEIIDKLPGDKDKLQQISEDADMVKTDIDAAQQQVESLTALVPNATRDINKLYDQSKRIDGVAEDLRIKIAELKEKIIQAQERANSIRVGLTVFPNTTLELRNPQELKDAGSFTKLSTFVNTTDTDGLLLYVGADAKSGAAVPTMDYMALELKEGKPVFKFDLGDGPAEITSDKNVADNKWHEIIAERTGRSGVLTVKTEMEEDVFNEGSTKGQNNVLNLEDPETTKIYAAGIPEDAQVPDVVSREKFEGSLEGVTFNNIPIGLWNFESASNNYVGAIERPTVPSTSTFHKFKGDGYVLLDKKRFNPSEESTVKFDFKTYSENALLFLIGDSDFMSVELVGGKVVFRYNLGGGTVSLESPEKYNDNKVHSVEAGRFQKDGLINVDGKKVIEGTAPGNANELGTDKNIWIGGYNGVPQVKYRDIAQTSTSFRGCLGNMELNQQTVNLRDNVAQKGFQDDCREDVLKVVSFEAKSPGYVAYDGEAQPINVNSKFETTFKIKTNAEDGMILYAANDRKTNYFAVYMDEGKLTVESEPGNQLTKLQTEGKYNDGRWHYVTVIKDKTKLTVVVDDNIRREERATGTKRRVKTTTPLYFGGVPEGAATIKVAPFDGCIGDITVNTLIVNFGSVPPASMKNVSLAGCQVADPETPSGILIPTAPTGNETTTELADKCVLPLRPTQAPPSGDGDTGVRFGTQPYSRQEYNKLPIANVKITKKFDISFEIMTTSSGGLLLYAADSKHTDFLAAYMKEGRVVFAFDCGSGTARLRTSQTYNDGLWHEVRLKRNRKQGTLIIDGKEEAQGQSTGKAASINVKPPYFMGGISEERAKKAASNVEDVTQSFMGCVRSFALNDTPFGNPDNETAVSSCSDDYEVGAYVGADGGYLTLDNNFKVGIDLDIEFEFRPRTLSGVIMSVTSQRGDYLAVQMINGSLIVNVNNGGGEITAKYTPPDNARNTMCNGEWHEVKIQKAKNVVALTVDGLFVAPAFGKQGQSSTDTNDPLYFGGVPDVTKAKGIQTGQQFVGCIRAVKFNKELKNFAMAETFGDVNLNTCPKY
ncbi:laminin subunit alpha isoform X2 [Lingula anatina]|uniref:Laminin subunit alpha isoform X2 n=1 Tax=Lingula anatina TaxID=7574 RepID=A0A1S3JFU6_LINAN|nr:laminin subunit alpha isoform X2 [Lingula anatina]|eukprot:XP_013408769.1 laminin subunit alpha isoform X2 [Lingula anatina]